MNKILTILFIYFFPFVSFSQDIKVNEKKYLTLLFDSNINSAITSNDDDYILEYNKNEPDNMALVKAKKKNVNDSSIIIKTENGTIFNVNIQYGFEKRNVLEIPDSLGTQTKKEKAIITKTKGKETKIVNTIRENDYTIGNITINDMETAKVECNECDKILKSNKSIKRINDEKYKIKIQLNNIYYDNNKLYFILNFVNESDLDYNLNYIKSYVDTGNENKSSSTQYLEKNPILIYNSNRTIPGNSTRKIVFVYEQFSIDNNKKLTFEVNENNGERNLFLKIPHFLINNPRKIIK